MLARAAAFAKTVWSGHDPASAGRAVRAEAPRARLRPHVVVPDIPVCDGSTRPAGKGPPMHAARPEADRQLPLGEEIFLDHVGHFVRDPDAASRALARAGFAPTPVSIQVNPAPDGSERLTGTGNVTAMLAGGYIEALVT